MMCRTIVVSIVELSLTSVGKLFELLVYRHMYGFVKGRSTVSNLLEYSSVVLKSIEDGCQVD
jgi:hypothetical protein